MKKRLSKSLARYYRTKDPTEFTIPKSGVFPVKPFINILRRIQKSHYSKFLMNNRMIMQCYTVDEDDDIGLHYILHIPDTVEYSSEFYDTTLILEPKVILSAYSLGHSILLARKKELKLKPKEVKEEAFFKITDHHVRLKFLFYAQDDLLDTEECVFDYPVSENDPDVENIMRTYWDMMTRVKPGGLGVAFDAQRYNLYMLAMNCPRIYYYRVDIGGVKVKIPLYKSIFAGRKEWREFFISIQETTIPMVYLYALQFTWGDVTDQYIGYIQNF